MKRVLLVAALLFSAASCARPQAVREPAVAGAFYPADAKELAAMVDGFLAKAQEELAAAQARALKFENFKLELRAKAGAEGKLFGSIGTADIAEAAVKAGQPITRSEVRMPTGPIRATGDHQVQLHLHTDVDVTLMVTIVAEE